MRTQILLACALVGLGAAPVAASKPRLSGNAPPTLVTHAAGAALGAGLVLGGEAEPRVVLAGSLRYRLQRIADDSLVVPALHLAVSGDHTFAGLALEAGVSASLIRAFPAPPFGLGVRADVLAGFEALGRPAIAIAPGLVFSPYVMTPDKGGDLYAFVRAVSPFTSGARTEWRLELGLALLYNLGRARR